MSYLGGCLVFSDTVSSIKITDDEPDENGNYFFIVIKSLIIGQSKVLMLVLQCIQTNKETNSNWATTIRKLSSRKVFLIF